MIPRLQSTEETVTLPKDLESIQSSIYTIGSISRLLAVATSHTVEGSVSLPLLNFDLDRNLGCDWLLDLDSSAWIED